MLNKNTPKVVTLVPFKSSEPSRIVAWKAVRAWWRQNVAIPIFVGGSDPQAFNISSARNRAAKAAGDWDIAVILDADTLVSQQQIQKGITMALNTGAVVYPYSERWELNKEGTQMFLDDPNSNWFRHASRHAYEHFGGCVIVTRELWDEVRGYDPGFITWGHEDGAFRIACRVFGGKQERRVIGRLYHLEHTPSPVKNPAHPQFRKNRSRMMCYLEATKQPNARELLQKLRDEFSDIV